MISVTRADEGDYSKVVVYLKGTNLDIAEEFAALSLHLAKQYSSVLDLAQTIIDNERMLNDEKEK